MKTLGILGGMGPKATAVLYDRIVDHTGAGSDQEHINTVILSDTGIPDRTACILSGETDKASNALTSAAKKLEASGAEIIIMPCNTAHYFIDDIRAAVSLDVLNMIELATRDAIALSGKDDPVIGVMATDGTLAAGVYEKEILRQGAGYARPSEDVQRGVMSLIYDDIKAGKEADTAKFNAAYEDLMEKSDAIILGCTELSVYAEQHQVPPNCVDAMGSLVRAAVTACGAEYKE